MPIPSHTVLMNPVLSVMKKLGGSASISEIDEEVIKTLTLTPEELAQSHDGRITEVEYRLAWARTYLKLYGLLDNSSRGVWVLTAKGKEIESIDPNEVARYVRKLTSEARKTAKKQIQHPEMSNVSENSNLTEIEAVEKEQSWQDKLWSTLVHLKPEAFERLCQRLLRESGFVQVEVTGRTGDGGIDGRGIIQIGGLITFPILFQCKRYQGSIGSNTVRDFRGAMVGRADRGLIITTGTFTTDAKKEATRDGAPPIDLVDGTQLITKLKELRLGIEIKTRTVEDVFVLSEWFETL